MVKLGGRGSLVSSAGRSDQSCSRGRFPFLQFVTGIVQAAVKIVLEPVFEAD
jgi:hypothetical protein